MQLCIIDTQKCCVLYLDMSFICLRVQNRTGPQVRKKFNNREMHYICLLYKDGVCLFKLVLRFDGDVELKANQKGSHVKKKKKKKKRLESL